MISPINEWWIVAAFAVVTVVVAALAYLLRQGDPPAVLYGNGRHDDAPGLRAWLKGERVQWSGGAPVERTLNGCMFLAIGDWMVEPAEIDSPRTLANCTFVYTDRRAPEQVTRSL